MCTLVIEKKVGAVRKLAETIGMAEIAKPDWQIAARRRWPQAQPVTGDGQFAVISRCRMVPYVRLFETSKEAFAAASVECGPACKGSNAHTWVKLEPVWPVYKTKPHFVGGKD